MWMMFLVLFFCFLSSSRSEKPTEVKSRSCSYVGVFHVEGNQRYNLTFEEAESLCKNLSTSLAQMEQIKKAYKAGLQTCRYGWIEDRRSVILRHKPHKTCAGNLIGMRFLEKNYSDAFCYDKEDSSEQNCAARSGIYLSGPDKQELDSGLVPADHENSTSDLTTSTQVYWTNDGSASVNASQSSTKDKTLVPDKETTRQHVIKNLDHENSTSDLTRLKQTTALESSTQVYWTNDGSASVNASQSFIKNNETKQTLVPDKDTTQQNVTENSDWLVILLVILAILVILLVCVVAATRKSCCGRTQTLIITKESRAEGNGKSAPFNQQQETIVLMNTEKVPASN